MLMLIQHIHLATKVWTILKAQCETQNELRMQKVEAQLAYDEKMSKVELSKKFVTRLKDLSDQMAPIGIFIISEDLVRRFIQVLSPKCDNLVTTLNMQVRVPFFTFGDFCSILQEEKLRRKSRQ